MATVQHTPGPWKISADGNDIDNAEGAGVCALYADETAEANARLIAAAPELLQALKLADKFLASLMDDVLVNDSHWQTGKFRIKLQATIEKAEGRT